MKLEHFLQSLKNLGLIKWYSPYCDYYQQFSYCDCSSSIITVRINTRKCMIWQNFRINDEGEITVTNLDRHLYDIDCEGDIVINKVIEMIKLYKQIKIELKKKELNKDFV